MLTYLGAVVACVGLSGCVFYLNPLCTDRIHNGEETDVDCGGTCGPCNLGDSCSKASDCDESTCVGGTCTAFACDNGAQGEAETDVDCGGGTCRKCAGGSHCLANTDCFNNTCVAGSNTCSSLTTISFADAVAYPSGSKTYALFSSDLDGDGAIDLAAANEQDSAISVFLNNGTGTFRRLTPLFSTGAYPTGGTIADFNHDGIPDVVTADYHGNSVSILFGVASGTAPDKGTGALAAKASYPTLAGAETSNLAVGDLDGDGNLDVIATNPQTSSVSQFMGRAGGTLAPAIDLPVGTSSGSVPYSAAIGDFDGDGKADVAIADVRSGTILVKRGNGNGTLQPELPYNEGGFGPYILITRDMDLDGHLDLVCANRGSDNVSVLLGRGDGTFRKAIVSSTGINTGPYSIAVTDFNLDGVPDVVTADFMSGSASVLLGIGDGRFGASIDTGATGGFCYGVAVGDFNGDTKPDFATANATGNNVTVKLSTSR